MSQLVTSMLSIRYTVFCCICIKYYLVRTCVSCVFYSSSLTNNSHALYILLQSKQRASIKWLLSKAFNNRVPENLQEPFYRDHEVKKHYPIPISVTFKIATAYFICLCIADKKIPTRINNNLLPIL